ncbi:ABC transporter permease [Arthrobacter sp. Sa2CUA1]|uniref:ABC transporter permease n=2 Tax=Arthrobacter TaxID=1663 RepID=A0ABR8UTA6_9MICC|nr:MULTISPECIES: ABC transporter permease [Arthrobacter]MBD7995754.1 ABC transporter permease [Arthrobacter gallicola]MBD8044590.1 ABC transporter permease [Arthrobacter pullicola]
MSVAQLAGGRIPGNVRRAAKHGPLFIGAVVVMTAVAVIAVFGPLVAPFDPNQLYVGPISGAAGLPHLMGTDDLGRDIFSRILAGAGPSVVAPIIVVLLSTVFGSVIGILSAWFGGWVDGVSTRTIEVIFAIPGLVLAVLAISMFGKGLIAPVIALSIAYLPILSRLVRAGARSELGKPYMAALTIQGVSSFAICFKHLIPALLPVIIAQSTIGFGYAMLDLAAISYLGLGAAPPASDWGVMISGGQPALLAGAPEQSMFPALMVVLTVLSVNILGARVTDWAEGVDR